MVGAKHWVNIVRRHSPVTYADGNVAYTETTEATWGRLGVLGANEVFRLQGRDQDDACTLRLAREVEITPTDKVVIGHESAPAAYFGEWDVVSVGQTLRGPRAVLARRWPDGR